MRDCQSRPKPRDRAKVHDRAIHVALLKHQLSQGILRVCVARIEFDRLFKSLASAGGITFLYGRLTALISRRTRGRGFLRL